MRPRTRNTQNRDMTSRRSMMPPSRRTIEGFTRWAVYRNDARGDHLRHCDFSDCMIRIRIGVWRSAYYTNGEDVWRSLIRESGSADRVRTPQRPRLHVPVLPLLRLRSGFAFQLLYQYQRRSIGCDANRFVYRQTMAMRTRTHKTRDIAFAASTMHRRKHRSKDHLAYYRKRWRSGDTSTLRSAIWMIRTSNRRWCVSAENMPT